jgi:hypothetical protein
MLSVVGGPCGSPAARPAGRGPGRPSAGPPVPRGCLHASLPPLRSEGGRFGCGVERAPRTGGPPRLPYGPWRAAVAACPRAAPPRLPASMSADRRAQRALPAPFAPGIFGSRRRDRDAQHGVPACAAGRARPGACPAVPLAGRAAVLADGQRCRWTGAPLRRPCSGPGGRAAVQADGQRCRRTGAPLAGRAAVRAGTIRGGRAALRAPAFRRAPPGCRPSRPRRSPPGAPGPATA